MSYGPGHSAARTVLVTGAAGGMCRGINARLAAAGHHVVCADVSLEGAEHAAQQLRAAGGTACAYSCDVSDPGSVAALHQVVTQEVGRIDVVVNAVGVLHRAELAADDDATFAASLEVNLGGPYRVIRAFLPGMVEQGWGRIVNISSIAARTGYPYPAYAAAKAGLSNLTRSLVIGLRGSGVTANAVCPGVVNTPMVIDAVRAQVARKVPTQQIIEPDEVGALVAFLVSEDARSINGAELVIDGGATSFFQLMEV